MKKPGLLFRIKRFIKRRLGPTLLPLWIAYPKRVACNLCGWEGRRLLSDEWHDHINCPKCQSCVRQRLFFAALQQLDTLSTERLIRGRRVIHFAPEGIIQAAFKGIAAEYATADLMWEGCDFRVDLSHMPEIPDGRFDVLLAFDVLEHVPDYRAALVEVRRVLTPGGHAVFTVPQKDGLKETYEDPTITTEEGRAEHFGERDHLRIFGDDLVERLEEAGFEVTTIDESHFSPALQRRHVLFPPRLSSHPLATNHRKVFFCQKPGSEAASAAP